MSRAQRPGPDQLTAFMRGAGASADLAPLVRVPPGGVAAGERLAVYRSSYLSSLREVLAGAFPVVAQMLGDQGFRGAARAFAEAHPPRQPVLALWGADFPRFLAAQPALRVLGYVPEMAALEWARHSAYFAADAAPVDSAALARLVAAAGGADALQLQPHPAATVLVSRYPLASLWQAHQGLTEGASVTLPPGTGAEGVVVTRPAMLVLQRAVAPADALFLLDLVAGLTLGEATQQAEAQGRLPGDLQALLILALETGLFTA